LEGEAPKYSLNAREKMAGQALDLEIRVFEILLNDQVEVGHEILFTCRQSTGSEELPVSF
jgi:hypothetical protein